MSYEDYDAAGRLVKEKSSKIDMCFYEGKWYKQNETFKYNDKGFLECICQNTEIVCQMPNIEEKVPFNIDHETTSTSAEISEVTSKKSSNEDETAPASHERVSNKPTINEFSSTAESNGKLKVKATEITSIEQVEVVGK